MRGAAPEPHARAIVAATFERVAGGTRAIERVAGGKYRGDDARVNAYYRFHWGSRDRHQARHISYYVSVMTY